MELLHRVWLQMKHLISASGIGTSSFPVEGIAYLMKGVLQR